MSEARYPEQSHALPPTLKLGRFTLALDRPLVMGVLNVTPDSFSDGGKFLDVDGAVAHAHRLIGEGADILDVGGESSRPGAASVGADEELRRIMPVLERLGRLPVPVSVDTWKPEVMRRALDAGAAMVNDIYALRAPGAIDVLRGSDAAVCLMHMQGEPRTMQQQPHYGDVVGEVSAFLLQRASAAMAAGIGGDRIVLDPGFGFGKTPRQNLELVRGLSQLRAAGFPLLAGLSRKSLLGRILAQGAAVPAGDRLHASVAAAMLAVQRGAAIVRVHDVAATREALLVLRAVEDGNFSFQ